MRSPMNSIALLENRTLKFPSGVFNAGILQSSKKRLRTYDIVTERVNVTHARIEAISLSVFP